MFTMQLFGVSFFYFNITCITRHSFIHFDRVNQHIGIKNYTKQIRSDLGNDACFFSQKKQEHSTKHFLIENVNAGWNVYSLQVEIKSRCSYSHYIAIQLLEQNQHIHTFLLCRRHRVQSHTSPILSCTLFLGCEIWFLISPFYTWHQTKTSRVFKVKNWTKNWNQRSTWICVQALTFWNSDLIWSHRRGWELLMVKNIRCGAEFKAKTTWLNNIWA